MKPPFRADHVGSLLRPPELLKDKRNREIQDRAVRAVVRKQEAIGLEGITDGELRRDWWHLDFLSQLEGVTLRENPGPKFGGSEEQPPIPTVTGKLRYAKPIMVEDFSFLRKNTGKTAKFTIPSPSMLHLRAGRAGISRAAYPDLEEFWSDAAAAYRAAMAAFGKAGCTYLQLDDVAFAYLCDPKIRDNCRKNGDDPEKLPRRYAAPWPRRCSRAGSTAFSWSSTRRAPAASSRCALPPREKKWSLGWFQARRVVSKRWNN